jgi:hypothetical protein
MTFGLLLFAMFYAPHKPPVFKAPHNHLPIGLSVHTTPKALPAFQPAPVLLTPSNEDSVPNGVPLINICYKDDSDAWVVGTTTLYSGNTKFEDSAERYEYTGSCPR